jgi:muramoyltetrapeptide carboxypeptidase
MQTIGIIAPSGAVEDAKRLERSTELFKGFGYGVKIFQSCYGKRSDAERLQDFHDAFSDDTISLIICARGGYGALRTVDNIDWGLISSSEKVFAGYSDITLFLMGIYKNVKKPSKISLFHSPMALNGFDEGIFEEFLSVIEGRICEIKPRDGFKTLVAGKVQAISWGGNLATIISAFGSNPDSYLPEEDLILFLEDLNEPNYKIDKMLRQIYRHDGLRERVKGLVFGDFLNSGDGVELHNILLEYSELFGVPSAWGYPITHLKPNATVPFGRLMKFDAQGSLTW